jgi:hypothetical protein
MLFPIAHNNYVVEECDARNDEHCFNGGINNCQMLSFLYKIKFSKYQIIIDTLPEGH